MSGSGFDENESPSWSFVTIARIRPLPSKSSERGAVNYRISDGISNEGSNPSYKILEVKIPEGADPGLVHNNKSGYIGFTFNEIFDEESSQDDIFHYVEGMILDIFQGINSTIFAYGQTGSGKTYSICGGDSYQDRGLIPRTLNLVFDELAHVTAGLHDNLITYKCLISFTEIFNESIYDLLDPKKSDLPLEEWSKIQIFENEDGLVLKNINVFEVTNEEEALNLFFMGTTNRSTSSTPMNHASSRSHAIFTIIIESEEISGNRIVTKLGKLNLVDLAGSERLYKSDNNKSMIKEGKSINLSLHFLEQVIISLREQMKRQQSTENTRRKIKRSVSTPLAAGFRSSSLVPNGTMTTHHIPYRNSLLTTVLRDSLGGNCKSCFLLTISLDSEYFEESISTLRFGQRCGEIQVKVQANLEIDMKSQLAEAKSKISELEHRLHLQESENQRLFHLLQEKEEIIHQLTQEELQPVTDEECEANEHLVIVLNEAIQNLDSNDLNGMKQVISHELKGYRKPILMDLLCRLSSALSLLHKQVWRMNDRAGSGDSGGKGISNQRKIFQEFRSFSMDSKFDDYDSNSYSHNAEDIPSSHQNTQPSQQNQHLNPQQQQQNTQPSLISSIRQNSFGEESHQITKSESIQDLESPRAESIPESPSPTPKSSGPSRLQRDTSASIKHGLSRKLKPLLDGVTIISHGMFGVKYKTFSLSPDGKTISWKELSKDEGKTFTLSDCDSFIVLENKHGKVHGGVMVAFHDSTRKSHEFEFPPGTSTDQDHLSRVHKWVELLNDLRVGKYSAMLDSGSLSSQMKATQLSTTRQISMNSAEDESKVIA